MRPTGDADTDSYSDSDFVVADDSGRFGEPIDATEKLKTEHRNLELLEKR
jgi:hypothetical protein